MRNALNEPRIVVRADINDLLNRLPPHDLLIGMLRYGAHLPHLGTLRTPLKLLLSHMVAFEDASFFAGKQIVVLDDTIYRGHEMRRICAYLTGSCGVNAAAITRAVAVINERSTYETPEVFVKRLPYAEYIVWKEALASVVSADLRPTERDYPLYYFEVGDLSPGRVLSHLQHFGSLHPIRPNADAKTFRVTLTLAASMLGAQAFQVPGLTIEPVCKIRFHLYRDTPSSPLRMVVIPMAFCRLNTTEFFGSRADLTFATDAGLRSDFLREVHASNALDPNAFVYYLVSRTLGAVVLRNFLSRLAPRLGFVRMTSLDPSAVDGSVLYDLPNAYHEFYASMLQQLPLDVLDEQMALVDQDNADWSVRSHTPAQRKRDPMIPDTYQITEFVSSRSDQPQSAPGEPPLSTRPISHAQLFAEYDDPVFVSEALDDLIESGLLRATDSPLDPAHESWGRVLAPGGEYKAQEIETLSAAWGVEPGVTDDVVREELLELWGPF